MSNYYDTLGIKKTASQSEIKKAYFKLSKKYHPDKNKDENAKLQFQNINEAYSILSDVNKRNIYDKFGKQGLESMNSGQMQNPFHFFNNMGGVDGDFEIPGFGRVRFQNSGSRIPKSPKLTRHSR